MLGIVSVEDNETLGFVLQKLMKSTGFPPIVIDSRDDADLLETLGVSDSCKGEDCNGEDYLEALVFTPDPKRALEISELLGPFDSCTEHFHKTEVVVVTDDVANFEPFDPFSISQIVTTADSNAYQLLPSLPALRSLGSMDPKGLLWEELESVLLTLSD